MEQIHALISGGLDLALLRPHASLEQFESVCVVREPLVAALPRSHPLAQGRLPAPADFAGVSFIMYSPIEARYFHDLVASAFSSAGVNPDYIQYTSQIHSMLALVRAGLGAALVPRAATSLHFEGVVFRPVRKAATWRPVELHIAWKPDNDNPARQTVLEACLEYGRKASAK